MLRALAAFGVFAVTAEGETPRGMVHAVTAISYALEARETICIVGESGSGKSVHAMSILGLLASPPARITGEIFLNGRNLLTMPIRDLRDLRGAEIGMVFQDPMSSLNPVLTIGRQLTETLVRHRQMCGSGARARAVHLLDRVRNARARLSSYAHELSGGQRQRVMIAMAIACAPKLLIADEPTTALDVTMQAEIIDLVRELKRDASLSVIWITHDLGIVAGLADVVQVMYAGRIIERGPVDAIFRDPRNAYTRGLLRSLPSARAKDSARHRLFQIAGAPPDLRDPPPGDPFAPGNPFATARCFEEMPPLARAPGSVPGHLVAAWYDLRAIPAAAEA